jgi:uncharacterized protein YjbJ (UPF0337 family)
MIEDKAAHAREGLLDNVAGKAKEVAGAVSGNDAVVEEGQLQQAEAAKRRASLHERSLVEQQRATEHARAIRDADRQEAAGVVRQEVRRRTHRVPAARRDRGVRIT